MSERDTLKARLAAEMAHVVFADDEVPSAAWDRIDDVVDEHFAECPTGRLRALVDDLDALRACDASPLEARSGPMTPANPWLGDDWHALDFALRACIEDLNPSGKCEVEEASGARSLEVPSHGR